MQVVAKTDLAKRHQPFLVFTALTVVACAVLIGWLDKPLALLTHRYAGAAVPFFEALTNATDAAYTATYVRGWPVLLAGLGLAYVVGRWVLRRRGATVLLITLLTHVSSVVSTNLL